MKKDIPELPGKAGFIKQILYYIAIRLCNIEEKISQSKPEDDENNFLKQVKELEQENNKLQEILQSIEVTNQELKKEVLLLEKLQKKDAKVDVEQWIALQSDVQQDVELARLFWDDLNVDPSVQFIRFIAKAGEWDQVVKVWDLLAARCKTNQRPVKVQEQLILEKVLAIHNLTSFRLQASLSSCDIGARYDYKKMERGNPIGDSVQEIWLLGLVNAGGASVKNVLVKTQ